MPIASVSVLNVFVPRQSAGHMAGICIRFCSEFTNSVMYVLHKGVRCVTQAVVSNSGNGVLQ